MALVINDRVRERSDSSGTGPISLNGAYPGYTSFSTVLANGDKTYYAVVGVLSEDWEVGIGTYSNGGLNRDEVLSSSNGGEKVDFPEGSKDVFITLPASQVFHKGNFVPGTSATYDVTHSNSDITPGRVIKTRDYGIGIPINPGKGTDLNHIVISGQYNVEAPVNGPVFSPEGVWLYLEVIAHSQNRDYVFQRAYPLNSNPSGYGSAIRIRRGGNWSPWRIEYSTNNFPPIGFVYAQYHPTFPAPSDLFGGTWKLELNETGVFFRTEGAQAGPFNGQIQQDAIRNITGDILRGSYYGVTAGESTGAFYKVASGSNDSATGAQTESYNVIRMDVSRVVPTAPENRPRNLTFRIWRKTAH